ncbi:MAG: LUD domain-containing protein [Halieaceae bacterium]|jgi:L-lactate dehydrogenase complex protein LldG|nr:LUD domain-containing protein [Halieaceae bacterium]
MTDSIRSFIMGKIRRAGRGASVAQVSSELQSLGPAPTPSLISESTSESFIANVLINKGTVECVSDRSAAVKAVADYLYQRFRSHKLVAGNDSRLAAMPWREAGVLPRFGSAENGDAAGLSYARLGIAETGSIVTWTGKSCPATNNLLVEDHIVIVELADLVTTMELAWERIHQHIGKQDKPRGINFISGPSSTADIEGKLVMGAHGPRSWHVILIGEVSGSSLEKARQLAGQ